MTIKMGQDHRYRTRDGRKVRILALDLAGTYPVVTIIGANTLSTHLIDGRWWHVPTSQESPWDILEIPQTVRAVGTVYVHQDGSLCRCGGIKCIGDLKRVAKFAVDQEVEVMEGANG